MFKQLRTFLTENRDIVAALFERYRRLDKSLMLKSELWYELLQFCRDSGPSTFIDSPLARALSKAQEAAINHDQFYISIRPKVAQWHYLRYSYADRSMEEVEVADFLAFKERLVQGDVQQPVLEFDLRPFERDFHKMTQSRSVGNGVEFLNRVFSTKLSKELTRGEALIFSFLRLHGYGDQPFMINENISNVKALRHALSDGLEYLQQQPTDREWQDLAQDLGEIHERSRFYHYFNISGNCRFR